MTVLQHPAGFRTGEDADDLRAWLRSLDGGPEITHTVLAACANPVHEGEQLTWFYVEADATAGVARRRCLACSQVQYTLDSADHWNYPHMHSCEHCQQPIMEVAIGLHAEPGADGTAVVTWAAVGVRCVGCGRLDGLTDLNVDSRPLEVTAGEV